MTGDITIELTRCCKKCGEVKPIALFSKKADCRFGVTGECKKCVVARVKDWKKANPEPVRAIAKRTYEKHRLVILIYTQLYKLSHPKKTYDLNKQWRHMNREHVLKRNREYLRDTICALDDWYVASLITKGAYFISRSDIPPGLVAAKRAHIQVTRQLSTKAVLP